MKSLFFRVGKYALAIILIGILLVRVDWPRFQEVLLSVQIEWLFVYLFLQLVAVYLSVKKWQVIAEVRGMVFEARQGFWVYLLGVFINNFMPATVGGDMYRGLWLGRRYNKRLAALYTVAFDRVQGLVVILVLGILLLPFFVPFVPLAWKEWVLARGPLWGVFVLILGVLMWIFRRVWLRWLWHMLEQILPEGGMAYLKRDWQTVSWLKGSGYAALFFLVGPGLANYVLFVSVGEWLPFVPFLFVIVCVSVVSAIPITFGNIGTKEWISVLLFGLMGVPVEMVLVVVILSRILQLLLSLLAVPQYVTNKKTTHS